MTAQERLCGPKSQSGKRVARVDPTAMFGTRLRQNAVSLAILKLSHRDPAAGTDRRALVEIQPAAKPARRPQRQGTASSNRGERAVQRNGPARRIRRGGAGAFIEVPVADQRGLRAHRQ